MVDYLSLTISIGAVILAVSTFVINYRRSRKTEQLKLFMEISSRLTDARIKIYEIIGKLHSNTKDPELIKLWNMDHSNATVSFMNHWELFALLVNTKELEDEKIINHYKGFFYQDVENYSGDIPGFRSEDIYPEIKKLLKKWDPDYYSKNFE
jgi:hypothetical protein